MFGRGGKEAAGGCASPGCTSAAEVGGYCPGHAIERYKAQTGQKPKDEDKKKRRR